MAIELPPEMVRCPRCACPKCRGTGRYTGCYQCRSSGVVIFGCALCKDHRKVTLEDAAAWVLEWVV